MTRHSRTLPILLGAILLATNLTAADDKPQKITLQKLDGRTWLVDAKGKPFFAHGITHVSNNRAEFDYAKITTKLGIRPCGGCAKRRAALNKLVPYRTQDHAQASP